MLKLSMNVLPVWAECRLHKGTDAEGKETENSQAEPKPSAPTVSPTCVFLTVLSWRALIWKEGPLHAVLSHLICTHFLPFFGHGQTQAIAEKKMLTGNRIFCCLQAYKRISDQRWCLLKNNQKKPIQMPAMISYQLSIYLLWARQKCT